MLLVLDMSGHSHPANSINMGKQRGQVATALGWYTDTGSVFDFVAALQDDVGQVISPPSTSVSFSVNGRNML